MFIKVNKENIFDNHLFEFLHLKKKKINRQILS